MSDFKWTEELTEFSLNSVKHATWAASNSGDMLRVVDCFQEKGGEVTAEEKQQIFQELGGLKNKDVFDFLCHTQLITESKLGLTTGPEPEDRPGFYTGQKLGEVIRDLGVASPQAKDIVGHNFIFHARESLSFCGRLMPPGLTKHYLKDTLLDHYVFNQKLNSFKFDNLIQILIGLGVLKEGDYGLVVGHAPPAMTFYQMASSYFYLSGWNVSHKVRARDLLREVDSIIPNRSEDYSVLGFNQFPIEGWGKHQCWVTPESFARMLEIGIIEPKDIAKILQRIVRNEKNPSCECAKIAAGKIKRELLTQIEKFTGGPPIGYDEVVRLLDNTG